ncbi:MAG: hypothetical protein IKN71_03920 [Alphaproteobacteria bacterium]|nr:hypothetical protein [Alphaproteobacteria bacterium]
MVKPNQEYLELAEKMRENSQRKNVLMEWLRTSGLAKAGVAVAAVAASLGVGGMVKSVAENEKKSQPTETLTKISPEVSFVDAEPIAEPAVVQEEPQLEDFERDAIAAEQEYQRIIEGKHTLGDAGTGWVDDMTPGDGAPQLTEDDAQKMYEAKSQVGTGMSMEEMDELGENLRQRAGLNQEEYNRLKEKIQERVDNTEAAKSATRMATGKGAISWQDAVAKSGYQK